jgi:tetratricopeptide (TPR) repeat protein
MKQLIYLLILFISSSLFATDETTSFAKANQLYQQGKYQEALTKFEAIAQQNSGQISAELYFNIANCYYQTHQVAPAIFNYEKALLVNPDFENAKTNLEFAKKLRLDDIKEIPKVGVGKLLFDFTTVLHYDIWAWLAVVFSILLVVCFVVYYFSEKVIVKRIFFIGMSVQILLIALFIFFGFFQKSQIEKEQPAIVFAEEVELMKEPNASQKSKQTLHEGTKVFVLSTKGDWKKVRLTDDTIGWIIPDAIKMLK